MVTLRIGPAFAFAPPFTLVRLPRTVRALLCIALASCLVSGRPETVAFDSLSPGAVVSHAALELALGMTFVLALQLLFAAFYFAGRTVDLQAGFGLATLIDPTTRAPTPLVGTLFAYAAGSIFFAVGGHWQLYRIFAASLDYIPLGTWLLPASLTPISVYLSTLFMSAFGAAGALILLFFLIDLAIALLSRTVTQMNVLILGFEVKAIVFLLAAPVALTMAFSIIAYMVDFTLESIPGLFWRE
jgi:flagellar biosynthesis protein FliR